MKDEEIAKQKHFGNAKGIKRLWKKLTWRDWERTSCHSGCHRYNMYCTEHFKRFCESDNFKRFMEFCDSCDSVEKNQ